MIFQSVGAQCHTILMPEGLMGEVKMSANCRYLHIDHNPEDDQFKSIDEFKWAMHYGAEVGFIWNGKYYFISTCVRIGKYLFSPDDTGENDIFYDTVEDLLNHVMDGKKLREIVTEIDVVDRPLS